MAFIVKALFNLDSATPPKQLFETPEMKHYRLRIEPYIETREAYQEIYYRNNIFTYIESNRRHKDIKDELDDLITTVYINKLARYFDKEELVNCELFSSKATALIQKTTVLINQKIIKTVQKGLVAQ